VGRRGTLFLSENPYPIDGASLRVRTRHFSGASLFGQLRRGYEAPAGVEPVTSEKPDAWIAAHRLEVSLGWPVRIGLYEAVAYGGRGSTSAI